MYAKKAPESMRKRSLNTHTAYANHAAKTFLQQYNLGKRGKPAPYLIKSRNKLMRVFYADGGNIDLFDGKHGNDGWANYAAHIHKLSH